MYDLVISMSLSDILAYKQYNFRSPTSIASSTPGSSISIDSIGIPRMSNSSLSRDEDVFYDTQEIPTRPEPPKTIVKQMHPPKVDIQMEAIPSSKPRPHKGMNVKDLIGLKGLPRENIAFLDAADLHRRTQLNPIQRGISNAVNYLPSSLKPYASTGIKGLGALGLIGAAAGIGSLIHNATKKKPPSQGFKKGGRVPKSGKYLVHKKEFIVKKGSKISKSQKKAVAKRKK
jgi:hypothetical protein